jgi:hypothetical protein
MAGQPYDRPPVETVLPRGAIGFKMPVAGRVLVDLRDGITDIGHLEAGRPFHNPASRRVFGFGKAIAIMPMSADELRAAQGGAG